MHLFLKNYVLGLVTPTSLMGFALLVGIILFWRNHYKHARSFLMLGTLMCFLLGLNPFTEFMIRHLESRFASFEISTLTEQQKADIKYVVVLSGGFAPNENQPLTSQLGSFSLARLIEGIRLLNQLPQARLILSGINTDDNVESQFMGKLALELGVDRDKIIVEAKSRNTFEHPINIAPIVGRDPFIIVTSALHMPRAMGHFKSNGLSPMAAPTQHLYPGEFNFFARPPYPRGENFYYLDLFFTESVGLIVAWLKGELN